MSKRHRVRGHCGLCGYYRGNSMGKWLGRIPNWKRKAFRNWRDEVWS